MALSGIVVRNFILATMFFTEGTADAASLAPDLEQDGGPGKSRIWEKGTR